MSDAANEKLLGKLERDQYDGDDPRGLAVVGAILKAQGAVIRDVAQERRLVRTIASLFGASLLFTALYGAILGLFQPGLQTLFAAAKLPIVVLGTALLCTPTFFVFNSILGSRLSFGQTVAIVLLMVTAAALILVAFAPIAWLFTMTTGGVTFLTGLHLLVFLIAIVFGIHVLRTTRTYLNYLNLSHTPIHAPFLRAWYVIVLFVALQMAYVFRPLLVAGPFFTGERGLFWEIFLR